MRTPRMGAVMKMESEPDSVGREVERLRSLEATYRRNGERMQRLQEITVDLARAKTLDQIATTVVDHGVAAVGAATGGIWLVEDDVVRLVRQVGVGGDVIERFTHFPLSASTPLTDALRGQSGVFLENRTQYRERYPESEARVEEVREPQFQSVACLPLVADSGSVGAITFAFESERIFDDEERRFLGLISAHAAQAFVRSRSHARELKARSERAVLYALLERVVSAETLDDVYEAALESVGVALGYSRCAILLYDEKQVMRFRAWRGLSDEYRARVEGHSPWKPDTEDPDPIVVADTQTDTTLSAFQGALLAEKIRSLAFIPLAQGRRRLLGKFMLYDAEPRQLTSEDLLLAESIASIVAQVIAKKLNEAEAKRAYLEAERASQMKDEFLAVVSHELRTPLAAIAGWASILKGDRQTEPAVLAKGIEVIERNARAQTKIIEDILDVSRIVSGKLVLDSRPISLVQLVTEALDSVRASAVAKEISLVLEPARDPSDVIGDPERLRQIVWNLLSNAVKFTPPHGRVLVRLIRKRGAVVLEVVDSGRGIEPEFLPHVFERFRQADASMTRRHGGLGLGLAIVRHLVELHGGHVQAASDGIDRGATFTVTFPVRALHVTPILHVPEANEVGRPERTEAIRLDGVRVLVVDDEPDAREVVSELLSSFRAEVKCVESVEAALAALATFGPVVIVSDVGMPDQDGYALVRKIRALDPPLNGLPMIALTAYARRDDAERLLSAGFQRFLSKPAEPTALATAVRDLVEP